MQGNRHCLCIFITIFGFGSFYMAYTGENTGGWVWMIVCAYGTYWSYQNAEKIKRDEP